MAIAAAAAAASSDVLLQKEMITLCLPPLSDSDPLFSQKKRLSDARNLKFEFHIPVPSTEEDVLNILNHIVRSARILHLDEVEIYFAEDDDCGPFCPKNELESLNSILLIIDSLFSCAKSDGMEVLQVLQKATVSMINCVGAQNIDSMIVKWVDTDAEESLMKWGKDHGVRTKLKIAYFEDAGRGPIASEDINIGDIALEIPKSLIISEDLVLESDMFDVLRNLEGITCETMLLLWSMRERYNSNSRFKNYFEALPKCFHTGLSFGVDALSVLEGTLVFEELLQAREHLHQQYDALCPTLCANHPDVFQPEMYSWDQYLWACELWYSNGMKIICSDGKLKTCLVPVAGLLNHSVCPHILRYGRMDPETKSLKFPVSRPCKGGEQCFLSYGSLPGSHLVTFYGFLPKGDNPYDVIPLDFDVSCAEDDTSQCQSGETGWTSHMIRGTWLSKSSKPHTYHLPSPLLAHLRAVLKGSDFEMDPGESIHEEIERSVLETILSIFTPMMEALGDSDEVDREGSNWDVKLALDYKDLHRRIISSILVSCTAGLRELNGS
ncbi:uncharacterized protein M6B38_279240 [Iris pallida]|uniref:SET domain-containing protein n=1 Tax=Iris pallida TaxID=29817 RepID=A0AAX6I099_IRIPA|nr:uncharacterized protein M6B38_279240 [Iris pallida]